MEVPIFSRLAKKATWLTKGKISSQGLKILDSALAKEPDNIEIRIVHAFVCKSLPEWLNRGTSAIEDFQYLQSRYEADPTTFSEQFYQQIQPNIEEVQKKIAAFRHMSRKYMIASAKWARKNKRMPTVKGSCQK